MATTIAAAITAFAQKPLGQDHQAAVEIIMDAFDKLRPHLTFGFR